MPGPSFEKEDGRVVESKYPRSLTFMDSSVELHQIELDPVTDRRLTRKLDLHILPWLFGIWFFAFIDRSNIGNAKISGLTGDLGLDGNKFNIALMVFYVSVS